MNAKYKSLVALIALVVMLLPTAYTVFAHDDHLHLDIDIKPSSDPNTINLKKEGLVPVAILGSADFIPAEQVVVSSLVFGPMHADHDHTGAAPAKAKVDDVNLDGHPDLVVFFKVAETGLTAADTQACLHGTLLDGTHFCGHDSVRVIG